MAYGLKYYLDYCNSSGLGCTVNIYEDGWGGDAVELTGQPVPFRKTYTNGSDFKFEPIRPSTAEVSLVFGMDSIDFDEFWTSDERKFKVEHLIGSDVDWLGFVIPNGFGYQLTGGLYYAELRAADGLSTLRDIPFADGFDPYGLQDLTYNNEFEFPFILVATEILKKLGLDLNLWTCVDVYERSMTKTGDSRDADPLAVSYVNVKTYINTTDRTDIPYWSDVSEVLNCEEVLSNLCYLFAAKVYQSEGVWRIKRVNVDGDYGTGSTQRYWRKYNTVATYIGREIVNKETLIPCATVAKAMIGTDHLVRMDDVYGAFRVNYDYTFVRDGDNPVSILPNGSFAGWTQTSGGDAPSGWFRWRFKNSLWLPAVRPRTISDPTEAGGFTSAIELRSQDPSFSGQYDTVAHPWSSLRSSENITVTQGDRLIFRAWVKTQMSFEHMHWTCYVLNIFRISIDGVWFLRNDITNTEHGNRYLKWEKVEDGGTDWAGSPSGAVYFTLRRGTGQAVIEPVGDDDENLWTYFEMILEDVPMSGNLIFDIIGQGTGQAASSRTNPPFTVYNFTEPHPLPPVRQEMYNGNAQFPWFTGLDLGRIPNEAEQSPSQDYIYENTTGRYTLQVDPIIVLNGDTQDSTHISNIIVPTNTTGEKNFWDTIDNAYGISSLGLVQCKSIMNLYIKPFRIMEGSIKAEAITMDTRFVFEALPGMAFALLKGTFNEKQNYLESATFYEVSDIGIPPGGQEGNFGLEPNFQPTSNQRCQKDGDGLNTGFGEIQIRDINPNSPTFGQTGWQVILVPGGACPIGEPFSYYWGSDDSTLDVANLTSFTVLEIVGGVQCRFTNPGGEYLYFVHLSSLGIVTSVFTDVQDEIISDFQYLSDITVDGYTYKVLRQNYVTADFVDLPINFLIS